MESRFDIWDLLFMIVLITAGLSVYPPIYVKLREKLGVWKLAILIIGLLGAFFFSVLMIDWFGK